MICDTLLSAPCHLGTAVSPVPVIAPASSVIIRSDCLRRRRDYDPPTKRTCTFLHEEAQYELKAAGKRVADRHDGPSPFRV